jgi:hypothetical protein
MEERNLDFAIEMSAAEWEILAQRVDALGREGSGLERGEDARDEIQVFFRPDDLPSHWRDWVGDSETYGATSREVARFHFNTGRPYAEIDIGSEVAEPGYTEAEVAKMQIELEHWVRGKWHNLLRESGIDK